MPLLKVVGTRRPLEWLERLLRWLVECARGPLLLPNVSTDWLEKQLVFPDMHGKTNSFSNSFGKTKTFSKLLQIQCYLPTQV